MPHTIRLSSRAAKALDACEKGLKERIEDRIRQLVNNPRPIDSTSLSGTRDLLRVRVGNYRIVYQLEDPDNVVSIVRIGHRRDVYRNLP